MIRVLLAIVFALAMAGPEMHACPIHSGGPGGDAAASHHQDQSSHQKGGHCTCPQPCCPSAVRAVLPPPTALWRAPAQTIRADDPDRSTSVLLPLRKHLLPLALAPPLALA